MSDHADAEIIAAALQKALGTQREGLRLSRATVTAVTGGLLALQQGGVTGALDAGYPRLLPKAPAVNDEVVYVDLGGAPVVLGVLGGATAPVLLALGAPIVGQAYTLTRSQASADTANTTTTDPSFVDAISINWSALAIPDGTYDISLTSSLLIAHSAGGAMNIRGVAGAANGGAHTINGDTGTTATLRVGIENNFNDLVVAGGITLKIQYNVNSSGTGYARNPSFRAVAVRKA